MSKDIYVKKQRLYLFVSLLLGLFMLATALVLNLFDLFDNTKAIVALSFIPFGVASAIAINLYLIKKHPRRMNALIISETDERLMAIKHETDSITFRILRWALLFFYLGYTFIVPEDIFEAPGWWLVLAFLLVSYTLQEVLFMIKQKKDNKILD